MLVHAYQRLIKGVPSFIHAYQRLIKGVPSFIHAYQRLIKGVPSFIHEYQILIKGVPSFIHEYQILIKGVPSFIHEYQILIKGVPSFIHEYQILIVAFQNIFLSCLPCSLPPASCPATELQHFFKKTLQPENREGFPGRFEDSNCDKQTDIASKNFSKNHLEPNETDHHR